MTIAGKHYSLSFLTLPPEEHIFYVAFGPSVFLNNVQANQKYPLAFSAAKKYGIQNNICSHGTIIQQSPSNL